jgi:hypothetical protein
MYGGHFDIFCEKIKNHRSEGEEGDLYWHSIHEERHEEQAGDIHNILCLDLNQVSLRRTDRHTQLPNRELCSFRTLKYINS